MLLSNYAAPAMNHNRVTVPKICKLQYIHILRLIVCVCVHMCVYVCVCLHAHVCMHTTLTKLTCCLRKYRCLFLEHLLKYGTWH